MAAPVLAAVGLLKHKLQELFAPSEERLVGIIGVNKPGKKKKLSYLVVTGASLLEHEVVVDWFTCR